MKMIRTFRSLKKIRTFDERYQYLRLDGIVGDSTFGYDRYINQMLYTSGKWRKTRDNIIIRDEALDLSMDDYEIIGNILVHHLNPITLDDIELERDIVYDPDNLVCTSLNTHNAIHYGNESLLPKPLIERRRNDTCPWR